MQQAGAGIGVPPAFQLVVIAASAGGLHAIAAVLAHLTPEFPIPIAVVQHVDPSHPSRVADILSRRTALNVKEAEANEPLVAGRVYIAPPNSHFMITTGPRVFLSAAEPVHFLRPSADYLFESAASYGPVIGVILSGTGSDGKAGVAAIKASGGIMIAQDEQTSAFFGMPQAAIETGIVDLVLPLDAIGQALMDLTKVA